MQFPLRVLLAMLVAAAPLCAVQGTVKDPSGAVIPNVTIEVKNVASGEITTVRTSTDGKYDTGKLRDGSYTLSVSHSGFALFTTTIVHNAKLAPVDIQLQIAEGKQEVSVQTRSGVSNNEQVYRKLRDSDVAESVSVQDFHLIRDVGKVTLRKGTVTFLAPVNGRIVGAVFIGDGEFRLSPIVSLERDSIKKFSGQPELVESFNAAAFFFTDGTPEEIRKTSSPAQLDPRSKDVLRDIRRKLRHRTERPRSMMEAMLNASEDMDNVEADILMDLYNARRTGFFSAYIKGQKNDDLRFHVKPYGAMPGLPSPEEVALVSVDPNGQRDGIWYLSHLKSEIESQTASAHEDKRSFAVEHYRIETAIARNEKLRAVAVVRFKAVADGGRVIKFGLLPNLRVGRVSLNGNDVPFIQQAKDEDGSLYVVLPEPMPKGASRELTIEYRGDRVLEDAGGGTFAVSARTSWYPSLNSFQDRATYDLTFKVPKQYTLVSVGKLVKEWKEEDFAATQWVSEVPLAVAGFNYGQFKKKAIVDQPTKYDIEGYATRDLPDYLRGTEEVGGMSPARLTDQSIADAQNSIRIFSHWFGEAPYGRIAITQQPQMNFGQSWPGLVYLPLISFLDSTQRFRLFGINNKLTDFVQEVTPHEVAHQWWGHIVGWATFHDQWLSEGFADFSAGLFLQVTEPKPDKYLRFLESARKAITEKNEYGLCANDAGPIWMGMRLQSFKNTNAYGKLVYPKGGFVLHMLRQMMWDSKTRDDNFKKMMREFVTSHMHGNASTESFQAVVEKHMTPAMNIDGNGSMSWFFRQWVFGTDIPKFQFDYKLTPQEGKFELDAKLVQSEVADNFVSFVSLYADFDGRLMRLGQIRIKGNSSLDNLKVLLPQKPKRVLINANYDVLSK